MTLKEGNITALYLMIIYQNHINLIKMNIIYGINIMQYLVKIQIF